MTPVPSGVVSLLGLAVAAVLEREGEGKSRDRGSGKVSSVWRSSRSRSQRCSDWSRKADRRCICMTCDTHCCCRGHNKN